jgi:hypothetical protein
MTMQFDGDKSKNRLATPESFERAAIEARVERDHQGPEQMPAGGSRRLCG